MLWSKLFIPTLREDPVDAEVASHRLLLRAGYVRQLAAGIYSYLYLAQRSLLKIQRIVREEMDAIGAQEMLLPALNPAEVWQESGRWDVMGDNMFRLKDRFGRDLCLGMTHEEIMTSIARGELRSYKQLPQIWYQIQTKFRDEPRPKSGLLRVRQFIMKDSYSFDIDAEGLDVSFRKHHDAYRQNLRALRPHRHPRGSALGRHGRQPVAWNSWCLPKPAKTSSCRARMPVRGQSRKSRLQPGAAHRGRSRSPMTAPEEFHTPNRKTIAEVAEFTGLPPRSQMKSLVMVADGKPVLALLRGDHQMSETKFAAFADAAEVRPAHPAEIVDWFGADPGSLGPIGIKNMRVVADLALEGRRNMIAGANKNDYHLRNVTPGRDFKPNTPTSARSTTAMPARSAALRSSFTRPSKPAISSSSAINIRIDGAACAGRQRCRNYAHYGILRDRHRAHSLLRHRAE